MVAQGPLPATHPTGPPRPEVHLAGVTTAVAPVAGVLFDYDGTLITVARPAEQLRTWRVRGGRLLGRHLGMPARAAQALMARAIRSVETELTEHLRSGSLRELDLNVATASAFAREGVRPAPGVLTQLIAGEQEAWWAGILPGPAALATLERLRASGLRLGLCSNAPYRPQSMRGQLRHLGFDRLLDSITFSSEAGWRKPAPAIFEAAMAGLGTGPERTVMVGDSAMGDIAGARRAGMRAVRTREHRDDTTAGAPPDAVIDRIEDLPPLLASWNGASA